MILEESKTNLGFQAEVKRKDFLIFNGKEVPLDRLSDLLEPEVTVGSRIVARRIMEPEMKRFYEPDEEGHGVIVTSRVKRVEA